MATGVNLNVLRGWETMRQGEMGRDSNRLGAGFYRGREERETVLLDDGL